MSDTPGPPTQPAERDDASSRWLLYAIFAALLAIVVVVTLVLLDDDEPEEITIVDPTTTTVESTTTTAPTTTTTAEPTTTTTPAATTTAPATTTTSDQVDTSTAVYPFVDGDLRFDDPVEAATAFAEAVIGFGDPVVGAYRAGDLRSGEVPVQPTRAGPETIVLVRQLDEHWWVLGAESDGIELVEPDAGAELRSPVTVRGQAVSSLGELFVELWTDGAAEPLALGQATVERAEPSPFELELTYDQRPATRDASLVVRSRGPSTSGVWEAVVRRVHL